MQQSNLEMLSLKAVNRTIDLFSLLGEFTVILVVMYVYSLFCIGGEAFALFFYNFVMCL